MKMIKKYWKEITIVILFILFVVNCTGKGNFERKYKKQVQRNEFVVDSMNNLYSESSHSIDSLNQEIRVLNNIIVSLNNEIDIYRDQNQKLANKPVIVKVKPNN